MAELADALDSGSSEHYAHASSSLVIRITQNKDLENFPNPYFFAVKTWLTIGKRDSGLSIIFYTPANHLLFFALKQ